MSYPLRRPFRHDPSESPAHFNRVLAQARRSQMSRRKTLSPLELVTTARLQLGEYVKVMEPAETVVR
jgi:hypothetical protein